jgi:7-carboxy-7-deazaguanine synthase
MIEQNLLINEIFSSIQGESTFAGTPCSFVRLSGCSLRCNYCDTSYAFCEGEKLTVAQITDRVQELGNNLVEITGGEPLLQALVGDLMKKLCDLGKQVLLETSGVVDIQACDSRVIRIIDIKTPNSGASGSFFEPNYDFLSKSDELKFVITNREDFDWSLNLVKQRNLHNKVNAVHFSPVMFQAQNEYVAGCEPLQADQLAKWILDCKVPIRLHLQLHRHVWDPEARGV